MRLKLHKLWFKNSTGVLDIKDLNFVFLTNIYSLTHLCHISYVSHLIIHENKPKRPTNIQMLTDFFQLTHITRWEFWCQHKPEILPDARAQLKSWRDCYKNRMIKRQFCPKVHNFEFVHHLTVNLSNSELHHTVWRCDYQHLCLALGPPSSVLWRPQSTEGQPWRLVRPISCLFCIQ